MNKLVLQEERLRRDRAGAMVQQALDLRHLASFLPGEPSGIAGAIAANDIAPEFLDDLAALYGVKRWDAEAFERVVVNEAFAAWRPGSHVESSPGRIHIVSPICPIGAEAAIDPRACQMCRAFHREVARRAAHAVGVHFDSLIAHGDASCDITIHLPESGE